MNLQDDSDDDLHELDIKAEWLVVCWLVCVRLDEREACGSTIEGMFFLELGTTRYLDSRSLELDEGNSNMCRSSLDGFVLHTFYSVQPNLISRDHGVYCKFSNVPVPHYRVSM